MVNKFHIWKILVNSIFIGLLLFGYSCSKKQEVHIAKTLVFDGKLYEMDKELPFSGVIYNTYASGKREYEGVYVKGRPNGLLIYWYENGQKMREGKLNNGSPNGRWKYYNQNGSVDKIIDH